MDIARGEAIEKELEARLERTAARLAASHRDAARKLLEETDGKEQQ